ncbi:zinc metalloprotease HtpX [Candidatus Dependentiae bacterium]|nr:zinc metalloprotease HtpX [Candidatus Dependentiae bacterium]MBU4387658.1 zinc metalloprotease HtpX [Candidatus Dependentiae bacterium]MCG2756128.1 zinc metalloprotease HtpX [Candidatus Dependentiae bacterium]
MFWNQLKTVIFLASLSAILFLISVWIGGRNGLIFAFVFSLLINFITYFFSDKIVLKLYRAVPLDENKYKNIYDIVHELSINAKIPMPKLFYIDSSMANAFATGRNPENASVAVTKGILEILEEHELRGVLAHELSHIKNRDILIATIAATIAMAVAYLADMLRWSFIFSSSRDSRDRGSGISAIFVAILMPIAATLIQLAISRSREYLADETGAKISYDPLALASALEKLQNSATKRMIEPISNAQASTASLFIVYPFSGSNLFALFSTHPPMEKRIAKLRAMIK